MKPLLVTLLRTLTALVIVAMPTLAAADEFKDFNPAQAQKAISAPLFVIIAYAAIWIVVTLFTVMLFRQQRAVRDELAHAQARLDALTADHDGAPAAK